MIYSFYRRPIEGSHFWCQPHGEGVPEEWKTPIDYFECNDVADLKRFFAEHKGQFAGVEGRSNYSLTLVYNVK